MINSVSSGKDTVNSNTLKDSVRYKGSKIDSQDMLDRYGKCHQYWLSKCGVELFRYVMIFGVKNVLSNSEKQIRVRFSIQVGGSQISGLQDKQIDKNTRYRQKIWKAECEHDFFLHEKDWCLAVVAVHENVSEPLNVTVWSYLKWWTDQVTES